MKAHCAMGGLPWLGSPCGNATPLLMVGLDGKGCENGVHIHYHTPIGEVPRVSTVGWEMRV
ncbi:hypothetical protein ZHAS_00005147 [Anopheles sinensis]|uniref:Uncharacterized protein n=1 Tax=Anopheles sinensis TaxID=74873 RepID=A0A084VJ31_ANOSI|nr:hypothetical protein ZHAS_00005147 [Anopheles sinensis]